MLNYVWFFIASALSGVLGGMGMGGGTILIPVLTIFLSVSQLGAQGLNLISFLPMAIVSLILHFKNKLVNLKGILFVIVPAVLFAIGGSVLSSIINAGVLKRAFGVFLVALSVVQFLSPTIAKKLKKYSA
ncbi:MAG: sulfite exporter TauE/SafE family protein [Clostridia bacterium]|nr:sulfite exporter TauE/SafE family protein [Clostridia bacterium]